MAHNTNIIRGREVHFRNAMQHQPALADASQLLAESASELGWDLVGFNLDTKQLQLPRVQGGSFVGAAMGWPEDCLNGWEAQHLGRYCPVTAYCGRAADSFEWDCDPEGVSWRGRPLSDEQQKTLRHYGQYAVGAVTVPVHRPVGKIGYVSWFTRNRKALHRSFGETYTATYVISHAFIHRLDTLEALASSTLAGNTLASNTHANNNEQRQYRTELTAREIECLNWAARGKTEEEIGIIIARSRETARFHLRNAIVKLNASNRTHAVALACSRGLISVF